MKLSRFAVDGVPLDDMAEAPTVETPVIPVPAQSVPDTGRADVLDHVAWAICKALHAEVADGPMSWSDLAERHEKRIREAATTAIEAYREMEYRVNNRKQNPTVSTVERTLPGKILNPKRGEEVWMVINNAPAKRYFVELDDYTGGCRVAFSLEDAMSDDKDEHYYDSCANFFASELDIWTTWARFQAERIVTAQGCLAGYRAHIQRLTSPLQPGSETGQGLTPGTREPLP